jgi:hypothetical protein
MSDISEKPRKTDFGYCYRGVNIRRIVGTRVFFQYNIDMGFGMDTTMPFRTLSEATYSIDSRIETRWGMFGSDMTNFVVHEGSLALKGLHK